MMDKLWNDIKQIQEADKLHIYGAGLMGKALFKCLSESPYNKKIGFFIVGNMKNNPQSVEGIPVIDIQQADSFKTELVLVALHEKHLNSAVEDLRSAGFSNVLPVSFDSDLWTGIREKWMQEHKQAEGIRLNTITEYIHKKISVYVVHSDADKELMENVQDRPYEVPIQVGAALSENCKYIVRDDMGDNISVKNKQYCELTALYWIWKNSVAEFVGLSHYRRRFQLSDMEIMTLIHSDIDVVVTAPVVNFNTVRGQYELDHDISDWDIMMEAIETLYPEYYETADKIQEGTYYYAYNMFIARKAVADEYCKWLFDILDYCDRRILKKENKYQNRYAGFLAERLMTIFFVQNQQYKLVVAKKHFMETKEKR